MEIKGNNYLKPLVFHALMGGVVFFIPILSKIIALLLVVLFVIVIVIKKNRNNEALFCAVYIMASEVFFRMTNGVPNNEYGKYSVMLFLFIGMYYSSFSTKSIIYCIFLLLLIPGIFVGISFLELDANIRKAIAFNLSGPVCLAVSAIYTFQRRITLKELDRIISFIIFPLISMVAYMLLYTPSNMNIFTGTESNFAASGGYGPNQVSTVLGLAMFAAFIKFVLFSKSLTTKIVNILLLLLFSYRAVITFSRGGVYTGIAMILLALMSMYFISNIKGRVKINLVILFLVLGGLGVFAYSIIQTGGMINNRYTGKDALGRTKGSTFSGREQLVGSEIGMFFDNPITGVGVGVNKQYREAQLGIEAASHNEISRMLAEHGVLGVANLLLLLIVPLLFYLNNRYYIFLLSFYIFWLLTINHAAMRIAAPALVYALALLKFDPIEKPTLYRK